MCWKVSKCGTSARTSTSLSSLCFFAALSSGLYFSSSLNTVSARFLSAAFVKRFSAGGTCSAATNCLSGAGLQKCCLSQQGIKHVNLCCHVSSITCHPLPSNWQPTYREQKQNARPVSIAVPSHELQAVQAHLEPLVQDSPLPLDAHILGPLHESMQVMLWCGSAANTWQHRCTSNSPTSWVRTSGMCDKELGS